MKTIRKSLKLHSSHWFVDMKLNMLSTKTVLNNALRISIQIDDIMIHEYNSLDMEDMIDLFIPLDRLRLLTSYFFT